MKGNEWTIVSAPVNEIPLFIKAGGFIPTRGVEQYVGEKNDSLLSIFLFPEGKSSYKFYEDDGETFNYKKGEYSETNFTSDLTNNTGEITADKIHFGYKNGYRVFLLKC